MSNLTDLYADINPRTSGAWWLAAKKDSKDRDGYGLAQTVQAVAADREMAMMPRRFQSYCFAQMMSGRPVTSQLAYGLARRPDTFMGTYAVDFAPMRSGFAASMADVYVNRLFAHPTFLQMVPDFGDFDQRQSAEDQTTWIEEQFEATKFWDAYNDMGLNSIWYGTGFLKYTGSKKRLDVCSVNPDELLFPSDDDPNPHETIQRVWMTKVKALKLYGKTPSAREAIKNAQAFPAFWFGSGTLNTDSVIALLEAWICAEDDGEEDEANKDKGRHCLVIGDYTILDEEYPYPELPFEKFEFHQLPQSTFGQGLGEILYQYNEWIDTTLQTQQESDIRSGTAKWMVEENSNVNTDSLGDVNAAVVLFQGKAPELVTPDPVGQYSLARLEKLQTDGMARAHVSLNSVAGEIPKGLTAAIAIEKYAQIDDANFAHQICRLEQLVKRSGQQLLTLGKRYETDFTMPGRTKQIIDWKKVDPQSANLRGYNVGRLGQTIAGRTQQLEKMVADGSIERWVYNKYLQMPNIDGRGGMLDMINAPVESIGKRLNDIVLKGKYVPPSPYLNLDYAKKIVESRILLEGDWGTPEAAIDRLRQWRAAVVSLMKQQKTAPADAGSASAPDSTTGVTPPATIPGAPIGIDKNVPGAPVAAAPAAVQVPTAQ